METDPREGLIQEWLDTPLEDEMDGLRMIYVTGVCGPNLDGMSWQETR
ncbi:hypothetical protein [Paenibacillus azoreducens]|nr:hypothetical protein [Paenibacillus azoreducens]